MLGKVEKYDDKKKDKRKKGKKGKAKGKTDISSVASRIMSANANEMSTSTLHTSIQESSEEEEEEEDYGEQNDDGDFPTYPRKKRDLKNASIGQLRYVLQFVLKIYNVIW